MSETLQKGTKEWLIYDVADKLLTLTSLSGTNPRFDVYDPTNVQIVTQAPLTVNGMRCFALIDTTGVNFVPNATLTYEVYLQFDTGPESPYIKGGEFILKATPSP